ncbi:MAG: glycosyltransferase family 39 protein [Candidatus Sumerlaeaceae bacterium]|nr:glycosyltransferase family 39 protein [Candidatus Sumerlaeaceae bacterium]
MTQIAGRGATNAYHKVLLLIWAIGLCLRLLHVSSFYYSPVEDQKTYLAYGELYMAGISNASPDLVYLTTRNPPAYPVFTGLVRSWFGWENIRAILYIQALFDSISIVLCAYAGRRLFNAKTALVAAFCYAIYRPAILFTGQIMTESMTSFFGLLSVCSFLWLYRQPRWWKAILVGGLVGCTGYFRVNILSVLGVFCLFSILRQYGRWRRREIALWRLPKQAVLMSVAVFAMLIPWGIRNSQILGHRVLFTGSTAERFLAGANPSTLGAYTADSKLPRSWQERIAGLKAVEKDHVLNDLANEFLYKSHTAYYLKSVIPEKINTFILNQYWFFTGQGDGSNTERPFGPRLRFIVLRNVMIVAIGLLGLLAPARIPGFLPLTWLAQFLPLLLLPNDARYCFTFDYCLILAISAVTTKVFFAKDFTARFRNSLLVWGAGSFLWTSIAFLSLSGPNLINRDVVYRAFPQAKKAVEEELKLVRKYKVNDQRATYDIARFPVSAGQSPEVAVEFNLRLEKPEGRETEHAAWGNAWPEFKMNCWYFDDEGTTIALDEIPHVSLSNFLSNEGHFFQVVQLPGQARYMALDFVVDRPGTVTLSRLSARGPIWYDPELVQDEEIGN